MKLSSKTIVGQSNAKPTVFAWLAVVTLSAQGCGSSGQTTAAPPAPVVEVAEVIQQDLPIFSEWIAALAYLEVLDTDTRYFNAQITLAQAQFNELRSLVQSYRSLGGGWQQKQGV